MAKLGWKVPLIGSWTLSMSSFIDNAGPNGEGARMPRPSFRKGQRPSAKPLLTPIPRLMALSACQARYRQPPGYDSVYLLAAAIKQAGDTNGDKIRQALEALKDPVEGVVTTYTQPFSATDHEAQALGMAVMGEVKGGRVVFAYDEDRKDAAKVRTKPKNYDKHKRERGGAIRTAPVLSGLSFVFHQVVACRGPKKMDVFHSIGRIGNFGRNDLCDHSVRVSVDLCHLTHSELSPGRSADAGGGCRPSVDADHGLLGHVAFGIGLWPVSGVVVERLGVARAVAQKSEFGWVMSTIALGVIFKNVAENIWGRDD